MVAEPRVWDPLLDNNNEAVDICDNCQLEREEHCIWSDCRVCPGEYHICVEKEGKLMQ